jgi:hypothetical protein
MESRRIVAFATKPRRAATQPRRQEIKLNPEVKAEKKQKAVNKVYMMQEGEEKAITVGEWHSEGVISSDRGETWQHTVQTIKKLTFLISNNQIVGLRSLYVDKHKASLEGRTLLVEGIYSYS